MDATQILADNRVVPVVVIADDRQAVELATTLRDAGLTAIEVPLRTPAALDAIREIAHKVPEVLIGAGSLRRADQFDAVITAGARFAVSPGATEQLITEAVRQKLPFVPGAATASEAIRRLEQGYELQKFFPAQLSGGVEMLRAFSAPLPEVRFFPTGGITAALASDYLQLSNVHCVGGTWIATPELIASGNFQRIGELAEAAAAIANG